MGEPGQAVHDAGDVGRAWRPGRAVLLVAALVALLVLAGGIGWWLRSGDEATGQEAVDAFLADYTASLDGTYRVEGEITRTMPDDRTLESGWRVVNRPPDRLQRSLGSTTGVVAGRLVNCGTTGGDGRYQCAPGAPAEPWEQRRDSQLVALDQYVGGDHPVYDVTVRDDGCYQLGRRRTEPAAAFGLGAEICIDRATGAVRRLRVEREGGAVDEMVAVVVSADVTDADFDLSEDATYDPAQPSGG